MRLQEKYREMIKEIQGIVGQQPTVFAMELNKKVTGKLLFQEACNFPSFIYSMNTQNVPSTVGFPRWHSGEEYPCQCRRHGFNPGLGRSPGGGCGNTLQYSCLENPHGQRSLVGYNPWDHKESDMIEQLNHHHQEMN